MVQAFLKKWWVESDFKAPNLSLSLRLKVSGCHYNSIYNNTWTKQVKQLSKQYQTQWSKCQNPFTSHIDKKNIFDIFVETLSLCIFTIWKSIVYNLFCRDGIYFDKILVSEYKLFKRPAFQKCERLLVGWVFVCNIDWLVFSRISRINLETIHSYVYPDGGLLGESLDLDKQLLQVVSSMHGVWSVYMRYYFASWLKRGSKSLSKKTLDQSK